MNQVTTLTGEEQGGAPSFPAGGRAGGGIPIVVKKGIAVNKDGDIIVADSSNNRIRKIDTHGQVTTVAGSGSANFADGQSIAAHFKNPRGVAVTEEGLIVVADFGNHRIRTITPEGVVTTLAGNGVAGFADGPGIEAKLNKPISVAIDHNGNVVVADLCNHRIRIVTKAGQVTTLAGSGNGDFGDGDGILAHFKGPIGVAVDCNGSIFVSDTGNQRIRKISSSGKVTTAAGNDSIGYADGPGINASFSNPGGLAADGDGNIVVADCGNRRIRMISSDGNVTTIAGSGSPGFSDGAGMAATFNLPNDVEVDGDGNILVADLNPSQSICIRKIAAQLTPPMHGMLPPRLPSTHAPEMVEMLEDPTFADVVFVVEDTQISAHKNMLVSRCAYFKSMFTSGFKEGKGCHVGSGSSDAGATNIAIGETTASAFKAVLRYIYTDMLEFEDKDILNVMAKAREMQLERVYSYTVRYCLHNVCVDNAVSWFIQADELKLDHLRELTLRFLSNNFETVRGAGGKLELLQEKPTLMMEVMMAINMEGQTEAGSNKRRRASAVAADQSN